jgi:hypothetical protein
MSVLEGKADVIRGDDDSGFDPERQHDHQHEEGAAGCARRPNLLLYLEESRCDEVADEAPWIRSACLECRDRSFVRSLVSKIAADFDRCLGGCIRSLDGGQVRCIACQAS